MEKPQPFFLFFFHDGILALYGKRLKPLKKKKKVFITIEINNKK